MTLDHRHPVLHPEVREAVDRAHTLLNKLFLLVLDLLDLPLSPSVLIRCLVCRLGDRLVCRWFRLLR